jgi:hypothetical protein
MVLWRPRGASGGDRPVGRWISYAEARPATKPRLSFRRFSSPLDMQDEVPQLLHMANVVDDLDTAAMPGRST